MGNNSIRPYRHIAEQRAICQCIHVWHMLITHGSVKTLSEHLCMYCGVVDIWTGQHYRWREEWLSWTQAGNAPMANIDLFNVIDIYSIYPTLDWIFWPYLHLASSKLLYLSSCSTLGISANWFRKLNNAFQQMYAWFLYYVCCDVTSLHVSCHRNV